MTTQSLHTPDEVLRIAPEGSFYVCRACNRRSCNRWGLRLAASGAPVAHMLDGTRVADDGWGVECACPEHCELVRLDASSVPSEHARAVMGGGSL